MTTNVVIRGNSKRRFYFLVALKLLLVVTMVRLLVLIYLYNFWKDSIILSYGPNSQDQLIFALWTYLISFALLGITMLITIILFARWLYRSYANLVKFQIAPLQFHAHTAVWLWIIPLYNLFASYKMFTEILTWYEQVLIKEKQATHKRIFFSIKLFPWAFVGLSTILIFLSFNLDLTGIVLSIFATLFIFLSALILIILVSFVSKLEQGVTQINYVILNEKFENDVIDSGT